MTAAELRDLFCSRLLREAGGTRRAWRLVVGEVKLYPVATHPHCNWQISPSGTVDQVEAVEKVADDLRTIHSIVVDES